MALPTGAISMSQVRTELNLSGAINLSLTACRTLAQVGSTGSMSMSNLRGKYLSVAAGFIPCPGGGIGFNNVWNIPSRQRTDGATTATIVTPDTGNTLTLYVTIGPLPNFTPQWGQSWRDLFSTWWRWGYASSPGVIVTNSAGTEIYSLTWTGSTWVGTGTATLAPNTTYHVRWCLTLRVENSNGYYVSPYGHGMSGGSGTITVRT